MKFIEKADPDVLGLDVAVDGATGMHIGDGIADVGQDFQSAGDGQRSGLPNPLIEGASLDKLHYNARRAVVFEVLV